MRACLQPARPGISVGGNEEAAVGVDRHGGVDAFAARAAAGFQFAGRVVSAFDSCRSTSISAWSQSSSS
jgi:hypothetical protein